MVEVGEGESERTTPLETWVRGQKPGSMVAGEVGEGAGAEATRHNVDAERAVQVQRGGGDRVQLRGGPREREGGEREGGSEKLGGARRKRERSDFCDYIGT